MTPRLPAIPLLVGASTILLAIAMAADGRPGVPDPAWNPSIRHPASAILERPSGGYWLLDSRVDSRGSMSGLLEAVSSDGNVLPSAAPAVLPEGSVHAMAAAPGGALVIAGSFLSVDGVPRTGLARLDSLGRLDPTFLPALLVDTNLPPPPTGPLPPDPLPPYGINRIAAQPDGGLLIWNRRRVTRLDGTPLPWLFRLRADGSVDDAFQVPPLSGGWEVFVLSDGRFVTVEDATLYRDGQVVVLQQRLARWLADGRPDGTFAPVLVIGGAVYSFFELGDRLLIGGEFSQVNEVFRNHLACILSSGKVDASFQSPFVQGAWNQRVFALSGRPSGPLFIAGEFEIGRPVPRAHLARLNPDGTLDPSFLQPPIRFMAGAVLALPDGGCLASSVSDPFLLRLQGDGQVGPGFFALETDRLEVSESDAAIEFSVGRYWGHTGPAQVEVRVEGLDATAGEDFVDATQVLQFAEGETRKTVRVPLVHDERPEDLETARIVLQNPGAGAGLGELTSAVVSIADDDGPSAEDPTFRVPEPSFEGRIRSLAVHPDGRILVAGEFARVGSDLRVGLARLERDGTLDRSFDPIAFRGYGTSGRVDFVRVRGSEILFSGDVGAGVWPDSEQITVTSFVGAVLRSGQPLKLLGNSFGLSGAVPYGADQWIFFGEFSTHVLPWGLARLGSDLGVDSTFHPASLGPATMSAVAVESDGRLLVASGDARLHRVSADGSTVDAVSLTLAASRLAGLASLSDGRFLAWGLFESKASPRWHPLLRCLSDGRLDPSFNPELDLFMPSNRLAYATQLVLDREGRMLVAMQAQPVNWQDHMQTHLIRLLPDGALDRSFEPVVFNVEGADNDSIAAITLQEDGAILVGGDFTHMNGLRRRPLVRLKGTGVATGRTPVVRALTRTPAGISNLRVSAAPALDSVLERSSDLLHWESVVTNRFPLSQSFWQDHLPDTSDAPFFYRIVQKDN